jgi:hypothetical protein
MTREALADAAAQRITIASGSPIAFTPSKTGRSVPRTV